MLIIKGVKSHMLKKKKVRENFVKWRLGNGLNGRRYKPGEGICGRGCVVSCDLPFFSFLCSLSFHHSRDADESNRLMFPLDCVGAGMAQICSIWGRLYTYIYMSYLLGAINSFNYYICDRMR